MTSLYLVTGVSGHLGNALVRQLAESGEKVRGLVLPSDQITGKLPKEVEIFRGDVTDLESLRQFFSAPQGVSLRVIHCAGIISISSQAQAKMRATNVGGTKNMLTLCLEYQVEKFVYVSSVHAIPEKPRGKTISEVTQFDPDLVVGAYAKSKAEATALVLETARISSLNVTVVHPSGIVGPYDYGQGHMTQLIEEYCTGGLPAEIKGGYDFVDVRDVAQGVISACLRGKPNETYILSNEYITVSSILRDLEEITKIPKPRFVVPFWLAKLSAPLAERYYAFKGLRPLYTPYSLYTLKSNGIFNHEKATKELTYQPRPFRVTLKDTVLWLQQQKRI